MSDNETPMSQGLWTAKVNELLSRLARDRVWGAEAGPLAAAGAQLALARAEAGARGGRPAGSGKRGPAGNWLLVDLGPAGRLFVRGGAAAAEKVNASYPNTVKAASLTVYLSRGGGVWSKTVDADPAPVNLLIRKAKPAEIARLEKEQAEE